MIIEIQIGDKTHHQDQSITLHNFSVIKTINNTSGNLMLLLLLRN